MSNKFTAVELVLAGAVAQNGTFTVQYPTGKTLADFENGVGHYFSAIGAKFLQPRDFTISFGATQATITYKGATTLPAGTKVYVQLEELGEDKYIYGYVNRGTIRKAVPGVSVLTPFLINLGAPAALVTNGVAQAQNLGAAGALTLNGSLVSNAVAVFDVPRNVVIDSGGADTAVLTITGTDLYGQTMVESITLNGTTAVAGKKAFKTVTGITSSAAIANGAFVGTGDVLGLPVHLPTAGYVNAELEDGATVGSAGTFVAGLAPNTPATATNADVRGTYDPNSACDGAKSFLLSVAMPDPTFLGNDQFAG